MNDMGDAAPIHNLRWQDAEPANDVQAKAWGTLADNFLNHIGSMSVSRLVVAVCNSIRGLKDENRPRVASQVELFVRTSNRYSVKGIIISMAQSVPIHDNYTCKGCGNTKCSTQEKSCWKCGSAIQS
jgi:hypothetical protein